MNSFTLNAIGKLMRDPDAIIKGNKTFTRFCLVGNDYAGKDEDGALREVLTTIWFVAFGTLGEAIAKKARKGDQLIVQAKIRSSNKARDGEIRYGHSYVVEGFRFGAPGRARREELESRYGDSTFVRPEAEHKPEAFESLEESAPEVSELPEAPEAEDRPEDMPA